jgi:pimeloyl-ACP methyl ester carboxylesterase
VEKMRDAKLVVVPRTGHIPHLESGDLFLKSVEGFLAE